MAVPAGRAQLGKNFLGVIAALAGNDDVTLLERIDRHRIVQITAVLAAQRRRLAADRRGREIYRLDVIEITLFHHALHKDRTNHAAPTDQTKLFHHSTSIH